eukprot:13200546-Alexandrium_andersonii.AAC.1
MSASLVGSEMCIRDSGMSSRMHRPSADGASRALALTRCQNKPHASWHAGPLQHALSSPRHHCW